MILYMLDTMDKPMIGTSVIRETRILPDLWPRGDYGNEGGYGGGHAEMCREISCVVHARGGGIDLPDDCAREQSCQWATLRQEGGGTSGKWAGLDTSRAPPPEQATLDKNVPSFLEKATAHMFLPFPPSVPPGGEACPALIGRSTPK